MMMMMMMMMMMLIMMIIMLIIMMMMHSPHVKILNGVGSGLRDGPLEKLWVAGGGGEFSSRRNFFRYQIPCMNFF